MNSYNGEASGLWNDGYRAINMCNIVLNYLPNFENENIQKVEKIRSECLFIRAVCHFEMLRMFSQPAGFNENISHLGIPIRFEMGIMEEKGAQDSLKMHYYPRIRKHNPKFTLRYNS